MANPGTINASNFFGGDKVEQYRQELVADGRIPGTKQNATLPELSCLLPLLQPCAFLLTVSLAL